VLRSTEHPRVTADVLHCLHQLHKLRKKYDTRTLNRVKPHHDTSGMYVSVTAQQAKHTFSGQDHTGRSTKITIITYNYNRSCASPSRITAWLHFIVHC